MNVKIPLSKPFLEEDDINEVLSVLKSSRLSMGPYLERFEKVVAQYVGVKHAVAVNSGTSALHLILRALDPNPNEFMLVPSFTFIASVNVALYEKLIPIFVDIEEKTFNVSPDALEELLIRIEKGKMWVLGNKVQLKKVRFFMGVDIFGQPLDWNRILPLLEERRITVVEDSCEALGSEYKGRKLGTFGIAGAFAFYPNKQITTGEGGVIVTNSDEIAALSRSMRNQGRGEGESWLHHVRLGYNYRMDEMSAALGCSQLRKIERIIDKREKVASLYSEMLRDVEGVRTPVVRDYTSRMSWFVYVVLLDKGIPREEVISELMKRGIQTRGYFRPVHLQPFFINMGYEEGMLPTTEEVSERTLALPFYTSLSEEEIRFVVENLSDVIQKLH